MAVPPKLDGDIGVDEWKDATKLGGFVDVFTNKAPEDLTDVYIGYDADAIYIAFYAHDTKPESIVGREVTPGASFNGEDTVTFRINPFGNRTGDGQSRFRVNVLNTESEEISGGRSAKREWRGEWQSATKRQPDGWTAEMRIPWKVLNYPASKSLSMDIQFERYQARTKVGSMWANTGIQTKAELFGYWTSVQPPARRTPIQYLAYAAPEYERTDDGRDYSAFEPDSTFATR